MSTTSRSIRDAFDNPAAYRIRVLGRVAADCHDYFQGMCVETTVAGDGAPETVLEGELRDQAALVAVLDMIYNLHLPVLSVERLPAESTGSHK